VKDACKRCALKISRASALLILCLTGGLVSLVLGCAGGGMGSLSQITNYAQSAMKVGKAVARTFQDITPEQEYYVGRAVGATIAGKFAPYQNQKATSYLNVLGQTLAQAGDRPETFGGYHFAILDSNEINAFAAPGGLIFVTRGMLRCCRSEDAVAAVLAHEIGHVQKQHGLQAIKKSRFADAAGIIGVEAVKTMGSDNLAKATQLFEDSLLDITTTLVNNGYSRAFESEADAAAVTILRRVGYDPNGLVDMLKVMQEKLTPGGADFARTHPSPQDRISEIQPTIGAYADVKPPKGRQTRFTTALRNV
jgi:beta-barrel assembly-enhancing protease